MSMTTVQNNPFMGEQRTAGFMAGLTSRASSAPARSGDTRDPATADHRLAIHAFAGETRTAGTMPVSDSAGGFGAALKNVIDVVNPLQHIPVISTLYRKVTGDELSPAARIAGHTLYGGPAGAALALANVATEGVTGRDIGDTVLAMAGGEAQPSARAPATAAIDVAAPVMMDGIGQITPPQQTQTEENINTEIPAASPPAHSRPATVAPSVAAREERPVAPTLLQSVARTPVLQQRDDRKPSLVPVIPAATDVPPQTGRTPDAAARTGKTPSRPATTQETAAPPQNYLGNRHAGNEMIAEKMMEGLDKYAAMQRSRTGQKISRDY